MHVSMVHVSLMHGLLVTDDDANGDDNDGANAPAQQAWPYVAGGPLASQQSVTHSHDTLLLCHQYGTLLTGLCYIFGFGRDRD